MGASVIATATEELRPLQFAVLEQAPSEAEAGDAMSDFLAVSLALVAFVGWMSAVIYGFAQAIEASDGGRWWPWALGTLAAFVLPLAAVIVGMANHDDHPNQLCISGHQEWVTHCSKGCYTDKEWRCTQWESK